MASIAFFIELTILAILFVADVQSMFNATDATKGQFLYHSLIARKVDDYYKTPHPYAGGALINIPDRDGLYRYVVTSAMSIDEYRKEFKKAYEVFLGTWQIISDNKDDVPIINEIDNYIKHPGFQDDNDLDDIAIIRLKDGVKSSEYVVDLPNEKERSLRLNKYVVTGFGLTKWPIYSVHDPNAETRSNIIQYLNLTTATIHECRKFYENIEFEPYSRDSYVLDGLNHPSILCAKFLTKGKFLCSRYGDIGNPLVADGKLFGVARKSGIQTTYPLFTKVSAYVKWIKSAIQKMENDIHHKPNH